MSLFADRALDAALQVIINETDRLYLCSAEPTTYGEATDTYALGYKASPSLGAIGDRTGGGRKFTVGAVTGGSVIASGDADYYALVDTVNSRLLVVYTADGATVTAGNTFSTAAFDIGLPDAA